LVVVFLLLAVLLTACAGEDSPSEPSTNNDNPANNAAASGINAVSTSATNTPAESLAARVNGEPITMAAFERERERQALGMMAEPATDAAFDTKVLDSMIEQVLVEQYAVREGITVTDAEVDAELAVQSQIASESGITLDDFVAAQLYTMDEYREAQRGMLILQKVSQKVVADVPATSRQVHARHILVKDEALARSLIDQLNQGADFAQLAIQYSLDGSSAPNGGDLDWISEGDLLQPEVELAIFALQPGQRSTEPVKSSLGYHIVELLEEAEGRPIDQTKLAEKKELAYRMWLDNQRTSATIERFVGGQ
jgi:parvulin-like peptidyl-prolyl isomerase